MHLLFILQRFYDLLKFFLISATHPIEVSVKGVPDDGVLKAKEGDDVELECEARGEYRSSLRSKIILEKG